MGNSAPWNLQGWGDPPLHLPFRSSGRECFGLRNWCSFQIPHQVSVATGKSESALVKEETGLLPPNFSTTGLAISLRARQSSPRAFKAALLWPSGSPLLPPALHPHLRPDPRQPGSHVRPVPHLLLTALWSSHLSLCWAPPTLQAPFLLCPSLESPS